MDDDIELIIPDFHDKPVDVAIITDFSQVQIQIHGAEVAEQILGNTDDTGPLEEYLEEEFDYDGIQEISDDPDDVEIISDRKDPGLINQNGLATNLGVTIKKDQNEDECIDITESPDTEDLAANAINTEYIEYADESEIPNEYNDVEKIPDTEISQYDAVIENYPDFYDVDIKEEIEPFMGTDYTNLDTSVYSPTHHEEEELPPEDIYHCKSRIILGSKPCLGVSREQNIDNEETSNGDETDIEQDNFNAFVFLENWDIKLKKSKSFCKDCDRLFATPNALMAHNTTEHSFLVPLNRNVAFKSTSKPVKDVHKGSARKSTSNKNAMSITCNHCNKVFPDVDMLNKHLYEFLSKKIVCNICKVTFNTQKQLISHNATHVKREQMKTNRKMKKKKEDIGFKKKLVYEEDLKKKKSAKEKFEVIPKSVLFHCRKCDVNLTTAFAGAQHLKVCKPNKDRKYKMASAKHCQTCGKKISVNGIVQHIKQHKICSKFKVYEITKNIQERVLCKCPKCNLHFSDCGLRMHLNACGTVQSSLCFKCNILFPKSMLPKHLKLHVQQNVKPKDFIVIEHAILNLKEDSPKMYAKRKLEPPEMLAKKSKLDCSKATDNVKPKKVAATNIKIKKEPASKVPDVAQKKHKLVAKLKFETNGNKVRLYHCTHCSCSVHYRLRPLHHIRKLCTKSKKTTTICPLCGLKFSSKTMLGHKKLHKRRSVTIHDMEFHDIATLKRIDPKMPNYPQCKSCKITFFDRNIIKEHICGEDYETCDVCNEKIHNSAFEVHTELHDYLEARNPKPMKTKNIPEIMKKYKSLNTMWHIVFSCQKCEIVTAEYDKAVEHSQGHLNNKVVTKNIKCYICNLKFDETCWSKHSTLHSQMNIDSKDFKVLCYNPKKLLTNEWFELFESLPEEQITQITNKGLYGFERRFEMKLLKEGRSEFTLYCCSKCKVCVRDNEIYKHINGPCKNCGNICKICCVPFCDISTLKNHQILHMNGIKKDEFRVVLFTKTSATETEGLTKVKEDKIDKLNVKIESNTKVYKHKAVEDRAKNKSATFKCPKKGVKNMKNKTVNLLCFTKYEPGADGKYLVYKCVKCRSCSYRYDAIQSHNCDVDQYYCNTCKQYYPVSHNIRSHRSTHFRRRDFVAKKIRLQTYDPSASNEEGTEIRTNKNMKKKENKKGKVELNKNKDKITVAPPKKPNTQNKTVKSKKLETDNKIAASEATPATIYKCECGLHYTSLKSIEKHIQTCPDDEISKENCSKCGLLFPTDILVSHLCKHHCEATVKRKDTKFVIQLYNHGESNSESLELSSKISTNSLGSSKSEVNSVPQDIESNSKTQKMNIESPETHSKMKQTANCEVKLYKCGACNVHYLSQGACYGHIRNHKPVNFITCIDCKHCNLQFTVNTIPTHVKRHHENEKSFDLSKVLIEEYQPRMGKSPPKIDLYIAADKVQSLQVSSSIDDTINDEVVVN